MQRKKSRPAQLYGKPRLIYWNIFDDLRMWCYLAKSIQSQCPKTPKLLSCALSIWRDKASGRHDPRFRDPIGTVSYGAFTKIGLRHPTNVSGRPRKSGEDSSSLLSIDPTNQLALAHWGSALRVLGDDREHWLTDYSKMIFSLEVPVPKEFSDTETYFAQLQTWLERLHHARSHP